MFGSNALETLIGVIFVFLCASLVCTALTEIFAALFRSRARDLERGIRNLLDGTSEFPRTPLQKFWHKVKLQSIPKPDPMSWGSRLLDHQLVDGLSKNGQQPSYVPSQTFATALMHLVYQESGLGTQLGAPPNVPLALSGTATFDQIRGVVQAMPDVPRNQIVRQALLPLIEEARALTKEGATDFQKVSSRLQVWYDHAMERVAGWYKRRTQIMLLFLGFVVAFVANIDSIAIFHTLARDPVLRTSLVALADGYVKSASASNQGGGATTVPVSESPTPSPAPDLKTAIRDLQDGLSRLDRLGIQIGWVSWKEAHQGPDAIKLQAAAKEAADRASQAQRLLDAAQDRQRRLDLTDIRDRLTADAREAQARAQAMFKPRGDVFYDAFYVLPATSLSAFLTKLLGLALTALAASLGAPFWFDVLNKFMAVRGAGKAPEEKPKDPRRVLQPESPKDTR